MIEASRNFLAVVRQPHFEFGRAVRYGIITRIIMLLALFVLGCVLCLGTSVNYAYPQSNEKPLLKSEELEQLVAPIALYPDALLAQVLMASTYPLEIVQAQRWASANPKINGKVLEDEMQKQTWDASVKSVVAVPQVLQMMNDKLDWTQKLGDAFLAQQNDLLNAVQNLRAKAQATGNLKSTSQQTVNTQTSDGKTVIVVEPADPQTVYVPTYNPSVVYGAWSYPTYPPYAWYPPGYVASNIVSFGVGMAVGSALWGNCNWGRGEVNVNVNKYNSFNRTNISNGSWQHSPEHRKGVPYNNANVSERFGRNAQSAAARDEFRGRANSGQINPQIRSNERQPGGAGQRDIRSDVQRGGGDRSVPAARDNRPGNADRAGAFNDIDRGAGVRQDSDRGRASREASARPQPAARAAPAGSRSAPAGGAARGGGGGRRR